MIKTEDAASRVGHIISRRKVEREDSPATRTARFAGSVRSLNLATSLQARVMERFQQWQLIDEKEAALALTNAQRYLEMLDLAVRRAREGATGFSEVFATAPWSYEPLEGEYNEKEVRSNPRFTELREITGEDLRFSQRIQGGATRLNIVTRKDGARQIFREVADSNVRQIDHSQIPAIIPRFETIGFRDGRAGVLIDWIEGHYPKTDEERSLCLERAEGLLVVPMHAFDLNLSNFKITDDGQVYFVDQTAIEAILENGLSPETADQRRPLFEEGKSLIWEG
ncbi:hypothetical protein A2160_00575 [Candidatus Beckwithbacteria bacterium RBG_13_42_9]|uniref:Uncharacterized protein n=1 Tax=Candidatus Beckwithbacteria bacterium RBG_13_42_9 TaxID=1797457 RepID=A0A1F5E3T5_9BACT|nr:MAG: hypothetical protein A2160_00575 [Candidatus Beckwithbacteria bacterium RBG_13_42_9]